MSEVTIIALLFGVGALVLVAELFIPSHGVLTVVGIGFLVAGVVQTFRYGGEKAGTIAILACLVGLPAFAVAAIRIWPKTWVGRRVAPPNPVMTLRDTPVPVEEMSRFVGRSGKTVSTLRPVGICEFDGRRITCVAEFGMIDAGVSVEGVRVVGGNLAVQAAAT
jgi:membrane-bound serine protease (ClpP class)